MKQILALVPSEREKECLHKHVPYRGIMPCTGQQICTMCGMTKEQIDEENRLTPYCNLCKIHHGGEYQSQHMENLSAQASR